MTPALGTSCTCGAINGGPSASCLLYGTALSDLRVSWANRITVFRLAYERLFHALAETQQKRKLTGPEIDTLDAARAVYDAAEAIERGR